MMLALVHTIGLDPATRALVYAALALGAAWFIHQMLATGRRKP